MIHCDGCGIELVDEQWRIAIGDKLYCMNCNEDLMRPTKEK